MGATVSSPPHLPDGVKPTRLPRPAITCLAVTRDEQAICAGDENGTVTSWDAFAPYSKRWIVTLPSSNGFYPAAIVTVAGFSRKNTSSAEGRKPLLAATAQGMLAVMDVAARGSIIYTSTCLGAIPRPPWLSSAGGPSLPATTAAALAPNDHFVVTGHPHGRLFARVLAPVLDAAAYVQSSGTTGILLTQFELPVCELLNVDSGCVWSVVMSESVPLPKVVGGAAGDAVEELLCVASGERGSVVVYRLGLCPGKVSGGGRDATRLVPEAAGVTIAFTYGGRYQTLRTVSLRDAPPLAASDDGVAPLASVLDDPSFAEERAWRAARRASKAGTPSLSAYVGVRAAAAVVVRGRVTEGSAGAFLLATLDNDGLVTLWRLLRDDRRGPPVWAVDALTRFDAAVPGAAGIAAALSDRVLVVAGAGGVAVLRISLTLLPTDSPGRRLGQAAVSPTAAEASNADGVVFAPTSALGTNAHLSTPLSLMHAATGLAAITEESLWAALQASFGPFGGGTKDYPPSPAGALLTSVVTSVNGLLVLCGAADGIAGVVDLSSFVRPERLTFHRGAVTGVALLKSGRLAASCSEDCRIVMWETRTGRRLRTLEGHTARIWAMAALTGTSGNLDAAASMAMSRSRFDVTADASGGVTSPEDEGDEPLPGAGDPSRENLFRQYVAALRSLRTPPATILLTVADDGTLRAWDGLSGALIDTANADERCVWSVATDPTSGLIATGGEDGSVRLWTLDEEEEAATRTSARRQLRRQAMLRRHARAVTAVAFFDYSSWAAPTSPTPDTEASQTSSWLLSGDRIGTLLLWDVAACTCIGDFTAHPAPHRAAIWGIAPWPVMPPPSSVMLDSKGDRSSMADASLHGNVHVATSSEDGVVACWAMRHDHTAAPPAFPVTIALAGAFRHTSPVGSLCPLAPGLIIAGDATGGMLYLHAALKERAVIVAVVPHTIGQEHIRTVVPPPDASVPLPGAANVTVHHGGQSVASLTATRFGMLLSGGVDGAVCYHANHRLAVTRAQLVAGGGGGPLPPPSPSESAAAFGGGDFLTLQQLLHRDFLERGSVSWSIRRTVEAAEDTLRVVKFLTVRIS